ncbi:MAG: helix-turn-helix transcriptional regulator [Bacilli bacterium]|jgi:putative transcriptional regulator|nr:helix-turn-helix transcriptional regulator [Bacilli bacterium]MDD3389342.1 helix-turn-helix transcriptional regulator [Bacilli bacterium]MDD4344890.1 helix-turn-helix transcriptional regulator [Bacilli bacterium]MDD4521183.1 helix-turn-helix transcriptional regulator [Bacilli bacterium]MDY0399535.1 helix-turn-helix transcriptional regulator [Bacilli bacterium]
MKKATLNSLRTIRKSHRMTLADLANKIKVSKAYLSMIETGKRTLDYLLAIKIAAVFQLKPDQIFYNDLVRSN